MTRYLEIDIDIAWDDRPGEETFGSVLERITQVAPSAYVKVYAMSGSGGGWPNISILVRDDEFNKLFEDLGYDEDDIETHRHDADVLSLSLLS